MAKKVVTLGEIMLRLSPLDYKTLVQEDVKDIITTTDEVKKLHLISRIYKR